MSLPTGKLCVGIAAAFLLAWQIAGATSFYTNFDGLTPGTSILTTSSGNGQWVDASGGGSTAAISNDAAFYQSISLTNYVVYQGAISNLFPRVLPDSTGMVMAEVLAQVVWCDAGLPDNTICPNRQGGVCVSNGYAYAWSTNGWLQLTNRSDTRQIIASNTWTKFTFGANYLDSPAKMVYYKVYVDGTNFAPADVSQRYDYVNTAFVQTSTGAYIRSSATFTSNGGVAGFYLDGSGAMDVPQAAPKASFVPTSSGIYIGAYQGTDSNGVAGTVIEFKSREEEGPGKFTVTVKDANGNVVWTGSVVAIGSGNNTYRLFASGLALGGKYKISITDEINQTWNSPDYVTVQPFAANLMAMSLAGITLQFSTIPDHYYDIQWTPKLGEAWQTVTTDIHAKTETTSVFVTLPDTNAPSGFFRILMK
jgi:hypothetical protein